MEFLIGNSNKNQTGILLNLTKPLVMEERDKTYDLEQ